MPRQTSTHVDSPEAVGKRLREARLAAGLTQTDLSFPGCTVGYVSRIESGARTPSLQVIRELAGRIGVTQDWLARGGDGDDDVALALRTAELALRLGDVDEAERLYAQLGDAAQPASIRARATAGLGHAAFARDETADAVDLLEQAFEIDPALDDPTSAETLGRAYASLGRDEEAIGVYRRFLARAADREDVLDRLRFSVLLADAQLEVGLHEGASELIGAALAATGAADVIGLARLFQAQSRSHAERGDAAAAALYARRSLALLEAGEHTLHQARAYRVLARAGLDAGRPEEALTFIHQGRARLGLVASPVDDASFAIDEARALTSLGRLDEAGAIATSGEEFARGPQADRGRCLAELALALAERGDMDRALELFELAIEALAVAPSRHLIEALTGYGDVLERLGRDREALDMYKRAAGVKIELDVSR